MPFEDFDHKAREAARHHQPAFDEAAWEKMQGMLEKHLPEKKNDRRPLFFFLLLFLLVGAGIWMMVAKPWQRNAGPQAGITEKDKPKNASGTPSWKTSPSAEVRGNEPVTVIPNITLVNNQPAERKLRNGSAYKTEIIPGQEMIVNNTVHSVPLQTEQIIPVQPRVPSLSETGTTENRTVSEPKAEIPTKLSITESVVNLVNPLVKTGDIALAAEKDRKTKGNRFSFSLTAGASTSSSEGGSLGRLKSTIGVGIAYTIRDKFSIRSGFYSGHKVYVSEPYEYHPPDVFWTYYPNLQQVNADCKIYEIPLSLAYHFGNSSRQNWFAAAGVSSYIMKTETYKFLYKNSSGQLNTRTWDFADKNQHLFSTLTLSGGYQRSLGKSVSFSVEPYLKLPLKGVGYGKVKLSSAGVLFSIDIKPFGKN